MSKQKGKKKSKEEAAGEEAPKEHELTEEQAKAAGITQAQADEMDGYVNAFSFYMGEPSFDNDGNLILPKAEGEETPEEPGEEHNEATA